MATPFEHNGIKYRAEEIDAMKQFHVVRRLAPVLAQLAAAFSKTTVGTSLKATAEPVAAAAIDTGAAVAGLEGVATALASLTDDDANYVLHTLLAHVTREQPGAGWHKVSNGSQLMFADLKLPALMFLAFKALQENLGDFFAAVPSDLRAAVLKANAP